MASALPGYEGKLGANKLAYETVSPPEDPPGYLTLESHCPLLTSSLPSSLSFVKSPSDDKEKRTSKRIFLNYVLFVLCSFMSL